MSRDMPSPAGADGPIRIARDRHGIPAIDAESLPDAMRALGWCHAMDRGLQMLLVRILVQGRAAEIIGDTPALLAIDRYFRRLNFAGGLEREREGLSPLAAACVDAYADGINAYFARSRLPWELRLLGYRMSGEPWTWADSLMTARTIGYVGISESQANLERFALECVQAGVPRPLLDELLPGLLNGLDVELARRVRLESRVIPQAAAWLGAVGSAIASNSWVLGPSRSESGKPILANDPHLEVNRLPPVWYEAVLRWNEEGRRRYALGATMPGAPGVIAGRTDRLAWGVTYAFMDCIDSWFEDCRDGMYRRDGQWKQFVVRREVIRRKKRPSVEAVFYENEHGTLEGDPNVPGIYLATRWSGSQGTGASSLNAAVELLSCERADAARGVLGRLNNAAWNWVIADVHGDIACQMSGLLPLRREGVSGFVPLAGWDCGNDWRGFAEVDDLPRDLNPPEGYIVAANEDRNRLGRIPATNAAMAPYRAERIRQVIEKRGRLSSEDCCRLQFDVLSMQARAFMDVLAPLLADERVDARAASILHAWDCRYTLGSRGATLFERLYRSLLLDVFGRVLGRGVMEHLLDETTLIAAYHGFFDRILLSERSGWFGGDTRDAVMLRGLRALRPRHAQPWGRDRAIRMKHLLLGGKVPGLFRLDHGPIHLPGGRATVQQVQFSRSRGRNTVMAPSYRMVTDLGEDFILSLLAGGVSDRPFTSLYRRGIKSWQYGKYRTILGRR